MVSALAIKIIMFMVMFIPVMIGSTLQHEAAHVQIYKGYGVPSEMHWRFNLISPAYVSPTNGTIAYERCNETCRALQAENEIAGYNAMNIWGSIFAVIFLYMIYTEIDKLEVKYG